jgi:riboflavin kinase/FMN adenylyltransferase
MTVQHFCFAKASRQGTRLHSGSVLTIGKFEGLHLGHKALITETVRYAKENALMSVVVTFEPHPSRILYDAGYRPLFTLAEREHVLKALGVDRLATYSFDTDFANLTPEDFCGQLFDEWDVRLLMLGEGYRFGRERAGTVETIKKMAMARDIKVRVLRHITGESKKISTSDIRAHIQSNALQEAESLLGFPFFVMGTVTHGKKIGNRLGFPTVNIKPPDDKFLPPDGVYITRVLVDSQLHKGVTNVGLRPSVDRDASRTVETFLLDFNDDVYGKEIIIEFLRFIRPERRFDTLSDLKGQITKDVAATRLWYT